MGFSDWIRQFRQLHDEYKKGALGAEDLKDYRNACDEFARALMAAQRLSLKPGEVPRHALRVARAVQAELESAVTVAKVSTLDLGVGGFSAILAKAPKLGDEFTCKLKLPGDPLETSLKVADVKLQNGAVRVSFAFAKLGEASKGRIETLVIDTALSQIAS